MYDKKECGNRLRQLREAKRKTQREVAKEVGICVDTICKVEQGKRCPSVAIVDLLSDYYKTTTDYIIRGYISREQKVEELLKNVPEQKQDVVERFMEDIKDLFT
ncbi:MAG: helix-turn-helix domain-containing protein [Clostridium sp.]|nr:helix-turn-helix domain-containing protein [Clostridium sp.]